MGNSIAAIVPQTDDAGLTPASHTGFYGSSAWIEGRALKQIEDVAAMAGIKRVASFPDLHPGRYGPVGMAALSDRLHPLLVGNDIGCGMALFELDVPVRKLRLDKVADRMRNLEGPWDGDVAARLEEAGIPCDTLPGSLGTIGGGNHFCELQAIEETIGDGMKDTGNVYVLVHSGSRRYGEIVLSSVQDGYGLDLDPERLAGRHYLEAHDTAVRWAALNRAVIAERAAEAVRCDIRLVCDVPHNLVRRTPEGWVHYKGAAAVSAGELAPVAGSRDSLSHVVRARPGVDASLNGISHGAGRKYDRASMHHRGGSSRSDRDAMERNQWGGRIVCEDRDLLLEEAAGAYKDAARVVGDLVDHGLVEHVASMRPLVTFKRARTEDEQDRRDIRGSRRKRT
ncbi:RNA ligase RtcB family protein [Agrobacterium rubi]|nr:RNA ligase RtcB family protein [Agrobacterium rubi]NTF24644.1 RNA ligase RtcB family protein [Agrobacterium rubi]